MIRVLLLGGSGQVGTALQDKLATRCEVHRPTSKELDLEDGRALTHYVHRLRPQLIINAAAYTAVDRAEEESARAYAINARAPELLAQASAELDAALIHYSTDYVFDGSKATPYDEQDVAAPLNVYGHSKLAGDEAIQADASAYLIFRTSWVYSLYGQNFLLTMRRLLLERDQLRVVNDQVGAPTWAEEIAAATAAILEQAGSEPAQFMAGRKGLYNLSCGGQTSWYGFANAIRGHMAEKDEQLAQLQAIPTEEYPTPAKRPRYSVLDTGRLRERFGVVLPEWPLALQRAWQRQTEGELGPIDRK